MTLALIDANCPAKVNRATRFGSRRELPGKSQPSGEAAPAAQIARQRSTEVADIENRRISRRVSRAALVRQAGIAERTYRNLLDGATKPQRRILVKLSRALDAIGPRRDPMAVNALYRSAFVAFAQMTGLDPAHVDAVPTNCNYGIHAEIGRARQAAFYLTVTCLDVTRADLRAVYSKAAASKAIRDVEERREQDPAFEKQIIQLGKLLTGRDLS